ncbi:unnamed protein product [Gongylonema pulchrum]|uniref:MFS domain-containing protein n=1 Tax=Gongylonema pulchrum TaxID=637853 RepID=A0A183EY65_9BILA|nr:unnamed protein product [Gongylonema pulchrum]VDN44836.1 unnamed protein product [Gongylonema pulchrum]
MNSMAAATYEDFLKNSLEGSISDATATTVNKIFVLAFGLLSTALAFAAEPLGGILRGLKIYRLSTYAYSGVGMVLMLSIAVPLVYFWNEANPLHIAHLTYYGRK